MVTQQSNLDAWQHFHLLIVVQSFPYAQHPTYAKYTENFAQQSNLFAVLNVVCDQTSSYAKHTESLTQQSDLFAAVNAVCEQMFPYYAEHTENSVSHSDVLLRSFLHFDRFLTANQPLLLDNYCKACAPQNHSPLRHLEPTDVTDTL